MENIVKLFKNETGRVCLFFYKEGSVFVKEYTRDFSGKVRKVIDGVSADFDLGVDSGRCVVCAKKTSGETVLVRFSKGRMKEKIISKNKGCGTHFFVSGDEKSFFVVYNLKDERGIERLVLIPFSENIMGKHCFLTEFVSDGDKAYDTLRIDYRHVLFFYKTYENVLAMREVLFEPLKIADEKIIFGGKGNVLDSSMVVCEGVLHIVFVTRTRYNCRVVYKNNNTENIKTIFEYPKIDSVLLCFFEGRLWIYFISGKNVFSASSDDMGESFCPVFRHKKRLERSVVKAECINLYEKDDVVCSQVYVYADAPNEIAVSEDIRDKFIPDFTEVADKKENEEVEIYKNKADFYENELKAANKKITELSKKLAQRNEEISALNRSWASRFMKLKTDSLKSPLQEESVQ